MQIVTIKDIARVCGVSVSTVSRAMNGHSDISRKTREHILQVIAESGYVPNNNARNLKRLEARAVALLVKGMDNTFFQKIIDVMEKEIRERRYSCILQRVEESEDEVELALELVREKKLRGIIFLGGKFDHPKESLERLTVPYVLSTSECRNGFSGGGRVSVDNEKESFRMVEYLCSLGHRRIAILTAAPDDESIGRLRFDGYRRALEAYQLSQDPQLEVFMESGRDKYDFASGYRMTKKLLQRNTEFTAIYATSDTLALGACRALHEAGIRVPQDCSVAGFDGLEAGKYYIPSLTTLAQPVGEIGRATVSQLFRRIEKRKNSEQIIFEGELIVRESTSAYQSIKKGV